MINGFTFFRSYYEAVKELPPEDYKESMNAILAYAFDGVSPENLSPVANLAFQLAKPNIDKSVKKSANGRKGGQANAKQTASKAEANVKQSESKTEANVKQSESKAEAIKDKGYKDIGLRNIEEKNNTKKKFVKPSLMELQSYANEIGFRNFDAQYFLDYYESNGWMVGKNHMKDWKATVRNWSKRNNAKPQNRIVIPDTCTQPKSTPDQNKALDDLFAKIKREKYAN